MEPERPDTVGEMQDLAVLETVASLDEAELPARLARDAGTAPPGRPWVITNMVASLDGAFAVAGRSGGLSSQADHLLFQAQRSLADVVLVGASTARAERYGRPRVLPGATAIRSDRGQADLPRLVVVSASGSFPADQPFVLGDGPRPLVVHPEDSRPPDLPEQLDSMGCGTGSVDVVALLEALGGEGVRWLVCEGGPHLLGQLAGAGAVDEFMLTLSPRLVGGDRVGLMGGLAADLALELHSVLRSGEHLMLDYRRA